MIRFVGIALTLMMVTGCTANAPESPPDQIASAAPSTADPSALVTPSPELTIDPTKSCDGLDRALPGGEITFIRDDRLIGASPDGTRERCLALVADLGVGGVPRPPAWNAPADRVLVNGRALARDLSATRRLTGGDPAVWSRPTGTSVVWIDNGHLMKRSSFGSPPTDISFLARHDDVTYHPAGEHIATTGVEADGDYGLFLATNIGTESKLLARGEAARFITTLAFDENGRTLYYNARHGPENWHLHSLSIGPDPFLDTLDKGPFPFEYVLAPFLPNTIAWYSPGDCVAGEPGTFKSPFAKLQIPDRLRTTNLHPVGWLPNGKIVVRAATTGCSTAQPGDVYVLSRKEPVLVDRENYGSVSVRVEMPPPPPPPGEEQEVVA